MNNIDRTRMLTTRRGGHEPVAPGRWERIIDTLRRKRNVPPSALAADLEEIANYDYDNGLPWPENNPVYRAVKKIRSIRQDDPLPPVQWADHQMREKDHGRWIYVCHPYHLRIDDLKEIGALEDHGLSVFISGYSQYHVAALRIEITKA